ncbi:MAG: NAD(P)-dependent oxidoreductase [Asgard group archaeon]|nr:NAD(P)-dependent oxidoreductase [Asgard group archaeon]
MAILITGGTGFVGSALIKKLVANHEKLGIKKEDIFVLVREQSNFDHLANFGIQFIVGDLSDPESLEKAVKNKTIVFHLGAVVLDQTAQEILHKVNVLGTESLLKSFIKEPTAKKFVFVSTWGVYGYKVKPKPMNENQLFDPTTDYHKSKVIAEELVWEISKKHNFNTSVARFPMILGAGDTLTTPRVIQAFFNKKVKIIGKGKNLFSGISVKDAASSLIELAFNQNSNGKSYNVKSFDISQNDYWIEHMKGIKMDWKIPRFPKWFAMFYTWLKEVISKIKGTGKPTITRHRVMRYGNTRILDISQIQNDLNWKPEFTDGKNVINDSINWLVKKKFIDFEKKEVLLLRKWEDDLITNNNQKKKK